MKKFIVFALSILICNLVTASEMNSDFSNEYGSEIESALDFDSCPVLVSPAPPAFFAPMSYCTNGVQGYRCFILGKNPNCPSYCVCRPQ